MKPVVMNDRVKLAELMKNKGLIQPGDKTYKEIINGKSDSAIIAMLEYYTNTPDRRK